MNSLTEATEVCGYGIGQAIPNARDSRQQPASAPRLFTLDASIIKAIRASTGLSQPKFARLINVDVGTLRSWEQGRRGPTGSAQALLKAIKHDPQSLMRALVA